MKRFAIPLLLAALPCLAYASFAHETGKPTLAERLEEQISRPEHQTAHWGLIVVDPATGQTIYEKNADQLFCPASVAKLFSVAAALDTFGAEHRFVTPIVRTGPILPDGTLNGDLILVATGHLDLGGRTLPDGTIAFKNIDHTYANGADDAEATEPNPLAGLQELATKVAAAGIKRVRGDVIIDDRLFEKGESTGSGPLRVSPVQINDNLIDVKIIPGEKPGQPARIEARPPCSALEIEGQVETTDVGSAAKLALLRPAPSKFVVRGSVPQRKTPFLRVIEIDDTASFARCLFLDCLRAAGVQTNVSPFSRNRLEALPPVEQTLRLPQAATLVSPPFAEEAKLILKVSHNLKASSLPALLAAHRGQRSIEDGMLLMGTFLRKAKVDVDRIAFTGGAGGARGDYATPRATAQLLAYMMSRPDFPAFERALPILGVDGTLHDAVPADSPARGKVLAKTGTYIVPNGLNGRLLLQSKALAGYVDTAQSKRLAFAFFVNGTHLSHPMDVKREGRTLARLAEIVQEGN